jgi:hypothetical protein
MTTKRKPDQDQRRRFEEAAREIGADETGEAFERAFGKIVPPKLPAAEPKPKPKKRSDK